MKWWWCTLLLACRSSLPLDEAASFVAGEDGTIGLSLAVPSCPVVTAGTPFSVTFGTAAESNVTLELRFPSGHVVAYTRLRLQAGATSQVILSAEVLPAGVVQVAAVAHATRRASEEQVFTLNVRAASGGAPSPEDKDGDCYSPLLGDCDDTITSIHPGAQEVCDDGRDNDCNGATDGGDFTCTADRCPDRDGDGHTSPRCGGLDCDDGDSGVHPGAMEICDGRDNDCDAHIDEDFDGDGDGFVACPSFPDVTHRADGGACPQGHTFCADCNDADANVFPGSLSADCP